MYYTYVLQNPNGILYKGSTPDIKVRLKQHSEGTFKSYIRSRGPWKLVHIESFLTRKEAEKREKFLKSGKGREFLKKIINKK